MDNASIIAAYRRYARNYDRLFGRILEPGRKLAIKKMNCLPGERVLEVGIGTGLSLPLYPERTCVVGIDISPHMLARSNRRISLEGMRNANLGLMDAGNMSFPDNCFDKAAAIYVASVVQNPFSMVSEMKRVCKQGGDLFFLNHFTNGNGLIGVYESLLSPFAKLIGFRPTFSIDDFVSDSSLDVVEIASVNMFGCWTLIHAKNG